MSLQYRNFSSLAQNEAIVSGANLRTGQQGIFPIAHVVDVDYNDFDPNGSGDDRKERYLLDYLGSIESSLYKGNVVLCQAVRKILQSAVPPRPHTTVLEISDKGIKMIDKQKSKVIFRHLKMSYIKSLYEKVLQ